MKSESDRNRQPQSAKQNKALKQQKEKSTNEKRKKSKENFCSPVCLFVSFLCRIRIHSFARSPHPLPPHYFSCGDATPQPVRRPVSHHTTTQHHHHTTPPLLLFLAFSHHRVISSEQRRTEPNRRRLTFGRTLFLSRRICVRVRVCSLLPSRAFVCVKTE
jgi:hypothetical protein